MQRLRQFLLSTWVLGLCLGLLACTAGDGNRPGPFERIDRSEEIRIGEENFEPVLQVRGGRYTLDPMLDSYVAQLGMRLARASGAELPWEFAIVNNSLPNAWSLPGGKVAINRGLLVKLESEDQLAAVLAHEIAHAANSHSARAIERGLLLEAAMRALGLGDEPQDSTVGNGAVGIQIIAARFSQSAEFEADADGMLFMAEAGFDLDGAIELQQMMLREMSRPNNGWQADMTSSHPPSEDRIVASRRIRAELQKELPGPADNDTSRFESMTRRIRAAEPAYVNYNVAIWELARNNLSAAHDHISKALQIENRDGRFHALHAEYYERIGNIDAALAEYDMARRLEPEYHAIHQGHGLLLKRLGRIDAARDALLRANALLQDAETHEALGDIAVIERRINDAIGHYTLASRSTGIAGDRARKKLHKLEKETRDDAQADDARRADNRRQSPN